ncbi:3'-5' exonuclease [Streptacidiphilus fuscans]|uniref:3'-5' exonuclease n=1 Tax=Streptacidiphilus fuscans TaxID=2789292 RepID=A0A931BD97_9ACTN|nr:3'-5' exonuclease [Streptacidiphilus fuscans]MBF9073486.1 3'-5' exonuclease [Streptacidiphilus fuscans]
MPSPQLPTSRGLAVVDVEASGRSPWRHRVVEIGVVLLDYPLLRVEAEFSTLIDPGGPVGPTAVHRIVQEQVVGAPVFREIAPHLADLLRGRVLVGHHVRCDHGFLAREFARIGVQLPELPTLCTMALAERALGDAVAEHGRGLAACAAALGLPEFDAHTALGDARATAALLRRLLATPTGNAEPMRALVDAAQAAAWPKLHHRAAPLHTQNRSLAPAPTGLRSTARSASRTAARAAVSGRRSAYGVPCAVPYGVPAVPSVVMGEMA